MIYKLLDTCLLYSKPRSLQILLEEKKNFPRFSSQVRQKVKMPGLNGFIPVYWHFLQETAFSVFTQYYLIINRRASDSSAHHAVDALKSEFKLTQRILRPC